MKVLVTGSAGHLGEALMRLLPGAGHRVIGLDRQASAFTQRIGSILDRGFVRDCVSGIDAVIHTATLHKPHMATHGRQDFVDTNVSGTLCLLEAAVAAGVPRFIFTSTTSAFGAALTPGPGAPAAWITEDVRDRPKNVYGATKIAAEALCGEFHREHGLACLILRTSRFFPEADDSAAVRAAFADANAKANEFLHRRVDLEDAAMAHLDALGRADAIGYARYIISATTPFAPHDCARLRSDARSVLRRLYPDAAAAYAARGWSLPPGLDRVYVNAKARCDLGWAPTYDFARILSQAAAGDPVGSALARTIGLKGYGAPLGDDAPYPLASGKPS